MAHILIVDDQKWVKDLCSEALSAEKYKITVTADIKTVMKDVSIFKPDLVLLNLYLKHGFNGWDVLLDIKTQNPRLPVLMITAHDKCLFDSRLSQANGYVINGCFAREDIKQKISSALKPKPASQ
ncbi:MAG: response regulator [Deltaproteobacteria bacterium]|nr:MAG: response regulator [Deltaproteobacteria bacterium]